MECKKIIMQILEEQTIPFSTQFQDVTKGINRIRYLKQKINNTYCLLKGINAIDDDDRQSQSSITNVDDTKDNLISSKRTNRIGLRTVKSQRYHILAKRKNLHQNISNSKQKQKEFHIKNKWNDNFFTLTQQKSTRPQTQQMKKSNKKIDTFYHDLLSKNLSPSNQLNNNISLKEQKKVNYNLIKKEKQQRKIKLQQQKENRLREMMKKKQKVQLQQKLAQKKIFLFMKQKDQDLKSIKKQQKAKFFKRMNQDIKEQLRLEQIENQRLKKIQQSLLMKENLKKIIQTRIYEQKNYQHQSYLKNQNKTEIISQIQLFDYE